MATFVIFILIITFQIFNFQLLGFVWILQIHMIVEKYKLKKIRTRINRKFIVINRTKSY